ELLRSLGANATRAERVEAPIAAADEPADLRPPHYWTHRVLAAGFSAEECQQIRGLDRRTLATHLLAIARDGDSFDLSWLLNEDRQTALDRLASNGAAQHLAA